MVVVDLIQFYSICNSHITGIKNHYGTHNIHWTAMWHAWCTYVAFQARESILHVPIALSQIVAQGMCKVVSLSNILQKPIVNHRKRTRYINSLNRNVQSQFYDLLKNCFSNGAHGVCVSHCAVYTLQKLPHPYSPIMFSVLYV